MLIDLKKELDNWTMDEGTLVSKYGFTKTMPHLVDAFPQKIEFLNGIFAAYFVFDDNNVYVELDPILPDELLPPIYYDEPDGFVYSREWQIAKMEYCKSILIDFLGDDYEVLPKDYVIEGGYRWKKYSAETWIGYDLMGEPTGGVMVLKTERK